MKEAHHHNETFKVRVAKEPKAHESSKNKKPKKVVVEGET
jgi:hypothetical protein